MHLRVIHLHPNMLGNCYRSRVKAEILGLECFRWRWPMGLFGCRLEQKIMKAVAAEAVAEEPQKEWRD